VIIITNYSIYGKGDYSIIVYTPIDQHYSSITDSAGRNAANVIAQQYGGSGTSVATCFVFGRIAGQNAATETAV